MKLLSLNSAARKYGVGSITLRGWVEKNFVRGIPVPRDNAKGGLTYKFHQELLEEDIQYMNSIRVERPVIEIDVNKIIDRILGKYKAQKTRSSKKILNKKRGY